MDRPRIMRASLQRESVSQLVSPCAANPLRIIPYEFPTTGKADADTLHTRNRPRARSKSTVQYGTVPYSENGAPRIG